jgi:hypothetical protein
MKVALVGRQSKHLFEESIDTEQVFVVGCRHGEQRFDARNGPDHRPAGVTPVAYNVPHDGSDDTVDHRKDFPMTALLTASLPEYLDEPTLPGRPELRLVQAPERRGLRYRTTEDDDGWGADSVRVPRRRVPVQVRRRRTILATMGLALALLALPLGGSGGASHTTGSTSAAQIHGSSYTVRAGDTLWSIAERVDPSGDPRPLVSQMASELGSYNVVPGELVTIP